MSPPLSPSTKTVTSLSFTRLTIVLGTFAPPTPATFFIPCLSRFITSALPSTRIISLPSFASGPIAIFSMPISIRPAVLASSLICSVNSCVSGMVVFIFSNSSLALSVTTFLFSCLASSIEIVSNMLVHGPTLSTDSIAAARMLV